MDAGDGVQRHTVRARRVALRKFIRWADERGLDDPREITKPMLERYQRWLYYYRKIGRPWSGRAADGRVCSTSAWRR